MKGSQSQNSSSNLQAHQLNKPKKDKNISLTDSKKNYQKYWKMLFLVVTVINSFLLKKIYQFQTMQEFDYIRKGTITDLLFYALPFSVIFTIIDNGIHRWLDPWIMKNYINEAKYSDLEIRKSRSFTLAKWAFSLFYYCPISIWGVLILQETSFMPWFLGGNGTCIGLDRYIYTFDQASQTMKIYYIIQFGKHMSRFFSHVFIKSEGNFYEYALHHALSTFLIFFSFLGNMWLIGIFVLIIHDISDLFLISARGYRDYKHRREGLLNLHAFLTIISWVSCRICLLSYCCVYSSIEVSIRLFSQLREPFYEILYFPYIFMAFMLFALEILQLFWTYYIASSFISISITQKVKHTYD